MSLNPFDLVYFASCSNWNCNSNRKPIRESLYLWHYRVTIDYSLYFKFIALEFVHGLCFDDYNFKTTLTPYILHWSIKKVK